jgi:hypothetical protein
MNIVYTPQYSNKRLVVSSAADVLTLNNIKYDFTQLKEGEVLLGEDINSDFILGNVTRDKGSIAITIIKPCNNKGEYND